MVTAELSTRRSPALLCLTIACVTGCAEYGKVSPATYDYAMALFSITNRQAESKLAAVVTQIEESRGRGELSDQEAAWLQEIAADAKSGNWRDANHSCRQMMVEQVESPRSAHRRQ